MMSITCECSSPSVRILRMAAVSMFSVCEKAIKGNEKINSSNAGVNFLMCTVLWKVTEAGAKWQKKSVSKRFAYAGLYLRHAKVKHGRTGQEDGGGI